MTSGFQAITVIHFQHFQDTNVDHTESSKVGYQQEQYCWGELLKESEDKRKHRWCMNGVIYPLSCLSIRSHDRHYQSVLLASAHARLADEMLMPAIFSNQFDFSIRSERGDKSAGEIACDVICPEPLCRRF